MQAICSEAGLLALRERRMCVTGEDFRKSKENVLYRKSEGTPQGICVLASLTRQACTCRINSSLLLHVKTIKIIKS